MNKCQELVAATIYLEVVGFQGVKMDDRRKNMGQGSGILQACIPVLLSGQVGRYGSASEAGKWQLALPMVGYAATGRQKMDR